MSQASESFLYDTQIRYREFYLWGAGGNMGYSGSPNNPGISIRKECFTWFSLFMVVNVL